MAIAIPFQIAAMPSHSRRKVAGLMSMITLAQFAGRSFGLPASLESFSHGGFSENPMAGELDHLHPQPLILSALKSLNPSNYSIFIEAIQGVDLENRAGTLTIFAPSDEAFKVIPKKTLQCMQTHAGKMWVPSPCMSGPFFLWFFGSLVLRFYLSLFIAFCSPHVMKSYRAEL